MHVCVWLCSFLQPAFGGCSLLFSSVWYFDIHHFRQWTSLRWYLGIHPSQLLLSL
jgi:hypothetical protein